jgi:eukaryotic-like serine/threonine-protein kinase
MRFEGPIARFRTTARAPLSTRDRFDRCPFVAAVRDRVDGHPAHAMTSSQPDLRTDDGASLDAPGALVAGRYRILERIGDGAMGAVFLAEHEGLQRRVALKFLHASLTGNAEVSARFAREAVAAARIAHPNVIAVHDSGVDEAGRCFLAMEYCRGDELRAVLERDRPMAHDRVIRLARQMASAFDHAHAMGIVHRDIKPENVLIVGAGADETVKVIDFGIARVRLPEGPSNTALTRTGFILGTPEYMAPEQGLGGAIDHRADLYAFAVVTYEMLVGRRPFDDDDVMVVIMRHVNATPPAPSALRPDAGFSTAVDAVFAKALAKSARDRFASGAEFVDALERALHAPPPTLPAPRLETLPRRLVTTARTRALALSSLALSQWKAATPRVRAATVGASVLLVALVGASLRHTPSPVTPTPVAHTSPSHGHHAHAPRTEAASNDDALASVMARVEALRARPELAADTLRERQRAASALEAMRLDHPDDAAVAYALGSLYARDRATAAQGVTAYRDALRAAPTLASDATLIADVVRIYAASPARAAPAEALLRGPLADTALDAMIDACVRNAPGHPRLAALLAEEGFAPRLDATQRGLLALSTAHTCEAKRAVIEGLGRDADARALPALRRVPTGRGCGFLGLGACNGCLGAALPAAMRAIEARAPDGG